MVELPKDAEDREIPLDTEVLYDKEGKRREVDWYTFYPDKDMWDVVFEDSCVRFSPSNLSLTPPDSWKKLEEDLDRAAESDDVVSCCRYLSSDKCADCPIRSNDSACVHKEKYAFGDILNRIRKLRGDGDA